MWTFKNVSFIFLFIAVLLIVLNVFCSIGVVPFAVVVVVYILILAVGATRICSGFYIPVICRGTDNESIAITFDDGPSEITPYILDILKQYQVQATFFCVGMMAEKHPDVIRRMVEEGHVPGNHSYSHHFWFDLKSSAQMITELSRTSTILEKNVPGKVKFFRPPYGVTNPPLARAVKKLKLTVIGWTLKSYDTGNARIEKLDQRLKKKLRYGDVVLFHDNRKITPELLKRFLDYTVQQKISVKRLDQLLNLNAYEHI